MLFCFRIFFLNELFLGIMSLFNDNLKNIKIRNLAIFIIVSYLILFILGRVSFPINEKWLYVAVILYFIFKLKDYIFDFKTDRPLFHQPKQGPILRLWVRSPGKPPVLDLHLVCALLRSAS